MDRGEVIASLGNIFRIEPPTTQTIPVPSAGPSGDLNTSGFQDSSIDLTPVPEGIRLTIKDIRFVADSAEFLPSEKSRLDLIATALKQIPERTFLVEGHTAAIGRSSGEMELSVERAKRMVDELVMRGISADRFIYKGWGGTKPVGDNSTDAGRSANRRVEITILE
jgi:outer membrane protein OmpA-like peptidoglycan-associated protein